MLCAACHQPTDADPCAGCGSAARLGGRYTLHAVLGQGAVGTTWRATGPDGQVVCVKEMPLRAAEGLKARERFDREVRVLRELSHPGVPRYVDSFQEGVGRGRAVFLVMELVDGEDLAAEMEHRRYDERDVLGVLAGVLDVLVYLHGLAPPVIHRDVKPRNVMRRRDGTLALVDFGAVRDAIADPALGGSTVAGTFGYMAPEQFQGDASPASDLYGAGALAVALLTRKDPRVLLDRIGQLRWEPEVRVSPRFHALLARLLAPEPRRRPPSARAARAEVGACLRDLDGHTHPDEHTQPAAPLAGTPAAPLAGTPAAPLSGTPAQPTAEAGTLTVGEQTIGTAPTLVDPPELRSSPGSGASTRAAARGGGGPPGRARATPPAPGTLPDRPPAALLAPDDFRLPGGLRATVGRAAELLPPPGGALAEERPPELPTPDQLWGRKPVVPVTRPELLHTSSRRRWIPLVAFAVALVGISLPFFVDNAATEAPPSAPMPACTARRVPGTQGFYGEGDVEGYRFFRASERGDRVAVVITEPAGGARVVGIEAGLRDPLFTHPLRRRNDGGDDRIDIVGEAVADLRDARIQEMAVARDARWCTDGDQVLVGDVPWRWLTVPDACVEGGAGVSWRLCPAEGVAGACIPAPNRARCSPAVPSLVNVHAVGATLWVVAERTEGGTTTREIAGGPWVPRG